MSKRLLTITDGCVTLKVEHLAADEIGIRLDNHAGIILTDELVAELVTALGGIRLDDGDLPEIARRLYLDLKDRGVENANMRWYRTATRSDPQCEGPHPGRSQGGV